MVFRSWKTRRQSETLIKRFDDSVKDDVKKQRTQLKTYFPTSVAHGLEQTPENLPYLQTRVRLDLPFIPTDRLRELLPEDDIREILGTGTYTTRQYQSIRQDFLQILATVLRGPSAVKGFNSLYRILKDKEKTDFDLPFNPTFVANLDWGTDDQQESFLANQYLFHPVTITADDHIDITNDRALRLPFQNPRFLDAGHNATIIRTEIPPHHREFQTYRHSDRVNDGENLVESVSFDSCVSTALTAYIVESFVCL